MKSGWFSRFLSGSSETEEARPEILNEIKQARAESSGLRIQVDRLNVQLSTAAERAQKAEGSAREAQSETADLRARLQEKEAEFDRVSGELEQARQRDAQALDEMLSEVDRERTQLRGREAEREKAREQLEAELQQARQGIAELQSELAKVRADCTHLDSELQQANAERQRLATDHGRLSTEAGLAAEAGNELAKVKEENTKLREELEQSRRAAAAGGSSGRGPKKAAADQSSEQSRRDTEIQQLKEKLSGLERELASRGSMMPVWDLPTPLQQMLANLGESADPIRLLNDLWERLMDQEGRFNAAREDTNRKMGEVEHMRVQMGELYTSLVTPITVLAASADLLLMHRGLPPDMHSSIEEMKQNMTAVRQAMARLQKLTPKTTTPRE